MFTELLEKVGWGKSEATNPLDTKDHEKVSKKILLNAVSNEDCFLAFNDLVRISSRRTFCAGWPGNEANVCTGDSGSGFYVKKGEAWILQGIVSSAPKINNTCTVNQHTVFTKVLDFSNWIQTITQQISTTETAKEVEMECKFFK